MLENGGYTDIAMTMIVNQRAFFVNNGLDKLNWHVANRKTEWSDDFHFPCPCYSISTTRDSVCCGNFIYSFTMGIVVCSVKIASIVVCVAGVKEKSEFFTVCSRFHM